MSKALCTFGFGGYAACLDVARVGFQNYAEKHGYEYVERIPRSREFYKRSPSWGKVLLLLELLQLYSTVTWLDCDMLVVDDSQDFADLIPPDSIQAITAHTQFKEYFLGEAPSCGIWYVTTYMLPWLQRIWSMTKYKDHVWWEQAAVQELLGYSADNDVDLLPLSRKKETDLYKQTYFLPVEWNSIEYYNPDAKVRFMHFPMLSVADRVKEMQRWQSAMQQNTLAYAET